MAAAMQYCPPGTPVRLTVADGYYSTPTTAAPDERSGQEPCPVNYVCSDGVRLLGLAWSDQGVKDTCGKFGVATAYVSEATAGAAVSTFAASTPDGDAISYRLSDLSKAQTACPDDPFQVSANTP